MTGRVTLAHCGSDRQGGVEPACDVPGRQGVIDNSGVVRGAGDLWKSQRGVDRVVDPGAAVAASENLEGDDVATQLGQGVVAHPGATAGIGDQDSAARSRSRDQLAYQFLAALGAHVH